MSNFTEGPARRQYQHVKHQLLINIIDGLAAERPCQAWAKIPQDPESYEAGYRKVTYAELARIVDNLAWLLTDLFGQSEDFLTLAYFGPWDPRHVVLVYAACKAGFKILLPSPAFAPAGILHLMEEVKCSVILSPSEPLPIVHRLLELKSLRLEHVPTVEELLAMPHRVFPYPKTYEEARNDPLLVLHSSGTTGPPKPLVWSQEWAARYIRQMTLMPPEGFESQQKYWQGTEMLQATPRHHGGTMFVGLVMAIATQTVMVYPLRSEAIALSTVKNVLKATHCDSLTIPPTLINQLATDQASLDFLAARIKVITFGSAPASEAAGLVVSSRIRITSSYGHTENGLLPCIRPAKPDKAYDHQLWNAHLFHEAAGGEMRPVEVEGENLRLHELVLKRNADRDIQQPVFTILDDDVTEWSTKDLFTPKPGCPDFWCWVGRTDDLIAFESGAKSNPNDFENAVRSSPVVKQAVMLGICRPRAALLVEPERPVVPGSETPFLEELWPRIEEANQFCGPLSTITRGQVMITATDRPLPLTAKGTVAKKATLTLYRAEIDKLYKELLS